MKNRALRVPMGTLRKSSCHSATRYGDRKHCATDGSPICRSSHVWGAFGRCHGDCLLLLAVQVSAAQDRPQSGEVDHDAELVSRASLKTSAESWNAKADSAHGRPSRVRRADGLVWTQLRGCQMRITGGVLAAFALASGLAAQQPPAPRPQATFRGGVTYVEVDAYVTNAHGDPVADLTANDFELIDAGSPQRITTFVAVNMPIAHGDPLPAEAGSIRRDVRTNTTAEGRIYLVVLDDLHVDGARTPAVRTALRRFIEQDLGPIDVTAIVSTSGRTDAAAEFTTDRRHLIDVIDHFVGRKLPSATLGQIQTVRDERFQEGFKNGPQKKGDRLPAFGPDPNAQERVFRAQKTMAALRRLSDFMAGVTGRRKAMVLVSEGVDVDVEPCAGRSSGRHRTQRSHRPGRRRNAGRDPCRDPRQRHRLWRRSSRARGRLC